MTALSSRIAAFADRRPKALALLAGALSATGFAPLHLWPLTLLALAYAGDGPGKADKLLERVRQELDVLSADEREAQ